MKIEEVKKHLEENFDIDLFIDDDILYIEKFEIVTIDNGICISFEVSCPVTFVANITTCLVLEYGEYVSICECFSLIENDKGEVIDTIWPESQVVN